GGSMAVSVRIWKRWFGTISRKAPVLSYLHRHSLGHSNADIVDVIAIPQRLEQPIGETEHYNVLDGLFPQIVIDAVNLALVQCLQDLLVEGHRRGEVVAERLLDDHAAPAAVRFQRELGFAELVYDGRELAGRCGEVEEHIARRMMCRVDLFELG